MTTWVLVAVVAAWIASGVGMAGVTFAWIQGEYPSVAKEKAVFDRCFALFLGAVTGPVGLGVALMMTRAKHGWHL